MTKYYSKKSDFKDGSPDSGQVARNASFVSGGDLPSKVQNILDDIQEAGQVVKDEGLEDKYTQIGDAVLAEDKDSGPFKKSYDRLQTVFEAAKRIHSEVLERIDSKFTRAMDQTFSGLNQVNGEKSPYQSKNLTYQEDRVLHSYNSNYGSQDQHYKVTKHYTLSELLDHEASPIQASKDVYDQRIKQAEALLKANDLKTDGKIKELEGKSAEEVVSSMYPGKIPDYQNLKANSFYEDNKEWLGWVETGLKIGAAVVIIVAGTVATFGTGTVASVAGGIALVGTGATGAESLYSAATGHTLIAGDQLTTEERWWAAADGAVTILSAGTSAYGKTPALVKNIVSKADDVNDIAQTAHAVMSGDNAELAVAQYAGGKALSGLGNLKKQDLDFSKRASKVDVDSSSRIAKTEYNIDLDTASKKGHLGDTDTAHTKLGSTVNTDTKLSEKIQDWDVDESQVHAPNRKKAINENVTSVKSVDVDSNVKVVSTNDDTTIHQVHESPDIDMRTHDSIDGGTRQEGIKFYRVQGGTGTKQSVERIIIKDDGTISIPDKSSTLYVSAYDKDHAIHFAKCREGAVVVEFEVPKEVDDLIRENVIDQYHAKKNPRYQDGMAPLLVDSTTPGTSYGLPAEPWLDWVEEYATNARVIEVFE